MNDAPDIASKAHLEKMISNRDYSVLINYSPPARCFTSEHSKQTFSHDLRLLEIRAVILSCMHYSAYVVKEFSAQGIKSISSEANGVNSNDELSKSEYLNQLNLHLEKLKNLYLQLESDPPTPIPKSVFGSFFGSKFFSLDKSMLDIIIHFIELIQIMGSTKKMSCMDDEWSNKMKDNVTKLTNGFEKSITYCQCIISKTVNEVDSNLKLEGRKKVLEVLSNLIDVSNINLRRCLCTFYCLYLSNISYKKFPFHKINIVSIV